ncbi:unknown protein [Simkania negevensis Z]|uniref:Uncharacterized protein n=1 Tax=Simkania negevensis (strain ATCC VR-1471 / DSM 27360 / Z) TaxID=331113 RepID=F8L7E9_SIMNZ|nr:unknown protein [Simkania negevensis Z]
MLGIFADGKGQTVLFEAKRLRRKRKIPENE